MFLYGRLYELLRSDPFPADRRGLKIGVASYAQYGGGWYDWRVGDRCSTKGWDDYADATGRDPQKLDAAGDLTAASSDEPRNAVLPQPDQAALHRRGASPVASRSHGPDLEIRPRGRRSESRSGDRASP